MKETAYFFCQPRWVENKIASKWKEGDAALKKIMTRYEFVYQEFDMLASTEPPTSEKPENVVISQARVASFPIRMQKREFASGSPCDLSVSEAASIKNITSYESGAEVPTAAVAEKIEHILEMS